MRPAPATNHGLSLSAVAVAVRTMASATKAMEDRLTPTGFGWWSGVLGRCTHGLAPTFDCAVCRFMHHSASTAGNSRNDESLAFQSTVYIIDNSEE
jgi:hypothetical protein